MRLNLRSLSGCALLAGLGLVIATAARADEFRTWTDSTGRYKLVARFVSVEDGQVTLARQDGVKVKIALEKLSEADQQYVARLQAASPFKPAEDSPFKPLEPKAGPFGPGPGRLGQLGDGFGGGPRNVAVDWSQSQMIVLDAAGAQWKITAPSAGAAGFRPRTVPLPRKSNFFEKISGVAINLAARKAVVGYTLARPGSEASTRIVFCDIERGRTLASGVGPGQMAPLALHDDGRHVLMRRDEFGFGNLDRLEIWSLQGKQVVRSLVWTPYDDSRGGARDVMWAQFIDASTLATSSRGGKVALWEVASAQPICHFQLVDGAVPALSPDRKLIAFSSSDRVGLFDVEKRTVVAVQDTPTPLTWPMVAFSPSGRKIGCIARERILVWDTASGRLEKNFVPAGIHIHGAIDFPHEGFILAAKQFLIALDTQLKLWHYQGVEHVQTVGGTTFLAVSGFGGPGALVAAKLPHAQAQSVLEKALQQPDLFVFRQGTPVRLNVSAIPGPYKRRVSDALASKLRQMKCPIQANAAVEVAAGVDGPKEKQVSYMFTGDYKVKEYRTWVKILYQGKPVWETSGTNIPAVLMLKRGENVGDALRKASAQPSYAFFERVVLPEFLQKPSDSRRTGTGQTLGACLVTPVGFR